MSAWRAAIDSRWLLDPPTMIGGAGCCAGRGRVDASSMSKKRPCQVAGAVSVSAPTPHMALTTSIVSSRRSSRSVASGNG